MNRPAKPKNYFIDFRVDKVKRDKYNLQGILGFRTPVCNLSLPLMMVGYVLFESNIPHKL